MRHISRISQPGSKMRHHFKRKVQYCCRVVWSSPSLIQFVNTPSVSLNLLAACWSTWKTVMPAKSPLGDGSTWAEFLSKEVIHDVLAGNSFI